MIFDTSDMERFLKRKIVMAKKKNKVPQVQNFTAVKHPPVSTEPLQKMSQDMRAIWLLCETRSHEGLDAALDIARRISYNDIIFTIHQLKQEYHGKPASEANFLPPS
jgi:hypothetical protein